MMRAFSDKKIEETFEDLLSIYWSDEDELEVYKLRQVFEANMHRKEFFPAISVSNVGPLATKNVLEEYLKSWGDRYFHAKIPSRHQGTASKSPYDVMVYKMLSYEVNYQLDENLARKMHEMAMQSENLTGELLEEYINSKIAIYGWIWCKGPCMVATDFYYPKKPEIYLQVKNKFNTENSSSSKIRTGTPIKKWNRLTSKRVPGTDQAVSNWEALRAIVFDQTGIMPANRECLSEEGFARFIKEVCERNPNIII